MKYLTTFLLLMLVSVASAQSAVTLTEDAKTWTLDNGIVRAIVAKESGDLVSLNYKNLEMLATFMDDAGKPDLERDPPGENRAGLNRGMTDHQYGFWSHDAMGPRGTGDAQASVSVDPKTNNGERAEVMVKGIANGRTMGTGPGAGNPGNFVADVEIRWALGRGESGVYTYCVFTHPAEYPATSITEARFCAKLNEFFDWMSVAQDEHHNKHYPKELREGDKYVYTTNQYNNRAFGWSSTTKNVGFFIINPSMEYMSGGPTKVEFLGHRDTNQVAAPCVLNYWRSSHYGGAEVAVADGEQWSKMIGPFMLFVTDGADPQAIYKSAREQALKEEQKWPFDWVKSSDYPTSKDRSTVKGQLVLVDQYAASKSLPNLLVGLTVPEYTSASRGPGGNGRTVDWQIDAKHYQFWARGNEDGTFEVPDVRPGNYVLRAFADGVLGELARADIVVQPGKTIDLGKVDWKPLRHGKPLWDIGIPNRNGSELAGGERFWDPMISLDYAKLFPDDITYTIGKSDFRKDFFFQHVPHNTDPNAAPQPFRGVTAEGNATPYKIVFDLPDNLAGKATLRVAIAGNSVRSIGVKVNDQEVGEITGLRSDGAIARHGSQGLWHERELTFDASTMKTGANTLTLTVPGGPVNNGLIYDYIRLELNDSATAMR